MRKALSLVCLFLGVTAVPGRAAGEIIDGITSQKRLITFDSSTPGTILNAVSISGLVAPALETFVGIDYRPANGLLYGVTVATATQGNFAGRLYTINPLTGLATLVNPVGYVTPKLGGVGYGFSVNPSGDYMRVISDVDNNVRLEFNGTTFTVNADVSYSDGSMIDPAIAGLAFLGTTLYAIDTNFPVLNIVNTETDGLMDTVGFLPFAPASGHLGFDISPNTSVAYVANDDGTGSNLYTLDLTDPLSGSGSTILGMIGGLTGTETVDSIAVRPTGVPEPTAVMLLGVGVSVAVSAGYRRWRKRNTPAVVEDEADLPACP